MLVEFIGCTGSGKSTIAANVIEKLADSGIKVNSVNVGGSIKMDFVTFPWFIWFAMHNLDFCVSVAKTSVRDADSTLIGLNLFRNVAKKMGMYELLKRKKVSQLIIWDEGTLHAAHNLFVHVNSAPRPADITEFVRKVPKPDLVVYIRTPMEITVRRTLDRGHRRVKCSLPDIRSFVSHAHKVFDALASVEVIQDRLLVVDNSNNGPEDIDTAAGTTVKYILDRLAMSNNTVQRF